MASFTRCDIVSAEQKIFSGQVTMVVAVGSLGQLGIMPGHAPLLTGLKPGPVTLRLEDDVEEVYFASGGFIEVQPGHVTILADTAMRADDIDEAAAAEAEAEAKRAMEEQAGELDYTMATAMLADATARQRTLDELRKRRR
ncbi:MAG: F0F1 ATP synthase subunit epsilon [Gammaproteobacteria bacterium]|nr:F0F1 ATP synthase subunit epsilon [Gammaproteobacteria bacterium]MYD80829.1 F0F1 ATP synthase subunit epsilon [Gammaproteobacteria bacterium]